ncbi:hypothetical protein CDL15_Pgr020069 [Punica granatum]|uniref:RIN4 pathogenic type III effector avirulence factor Avr cleavage site domain-containing protein n=1 Tax=Punica granatum TaxID=22663 RepID=A0A218VQJ9_PUNGR|nr:hypothetical protein CDL15_Pgr020069 [Punica granatum]
MAQRAAVPKFGNWNTGEDIGYTLCFENARKGRGGAKPHNPNDPQESPYLLSEDSRSPRTQASHFRPTPRTPTHDMKNEGPASRMRTPPHEPQGQGSGHRLPQERKMRADHGYHGRYSSSPARKDNNPHVRMHNSNTNPSNQGSPGRPNYGELQKRAGKDSAGSQHSFEQSPHRHQGKDSSRSSATLPTREGKGSYESSYATPGRPRTSPLSPGNGNFDRGVALPKFGEWNAQNPSMGDGYTQIFNKAREEKHQRGAGMSPGRFPGSPYNGPKKPTGNEEPMGGCCFPWGRK